MHLLNARAVAPEAAGEAVDLGQTPGDLVLLAAADSELACLASAQARRPAGSPSLRLANLLQLGHPMSVDRYVEQVIARARLVVLRLLGGRSYWPYGLEQVAAACRAGGIPLAVLPGDDQPDPELAGWSTLPPAACHRLWQYGVHGGLDNAQGLLAYAASLLGEGEPWREPAPLLRAGLYWPGLAHPGIDELRHAWRAARPVAALVFYRALVQAGDLAAIDALIAALQAAGLNPLPVFTREPQGPGGSAARAPPARRGAAHGRPQRHRLCGLEPRRRGAATPLDEPGRTGAAAGARRRQRGCLAGRQPRPLAARSRDERGAARDRRPHPDPRRRLQGRGSASIRAPRAPSSASRRAPTASRFVAELAAAWARLRRLPGAERRVALVLANYPTRDGRLANGVGLDTPASHRGPAARDARRGLPRSSDPPEDGQALMERAPRRRHQRARRARQPPGAEPLPLDNYREFFDDLPGSSRQQSQSAGAPPDADPLRRGRRLRARACCRSATSWSASSRRAATTSTPPRPTTTPTCVPPHGYLAFYAWLRRSFGAPCRRPRGQARQPRMAARQGAGAVGGLLARGRARPPAAPLPVHRQRPGRGQPGQAARRRR